MESDSATCDLPTVWSQFDYRRFVGEWIAARQRLRPSYSYAVFARFAGCTAGHVRNVVRGERDLQPPVLEGFIRALGLTEPEADAFDLLVRFSQARTDAERGRIYALMCQHRKRHLGDEAASVFLYLTRWTYVAVRELAFTPGFRADPDWISQAIRPPISRQEAAEALESLVTLGLLAPDAAGRLRPVDAFLRPDPRFAGLAMTRAHESALALRESLLSARRPDGLVVRRIARVPASRLPEIRALAEELHAEFDSFLREAQAAMASESSPSHVAQMMVTAVPAFRLESMPDP